MFSYLIEASFCLICLYLFYLLVLSREKLLHLNRYYLLFSVIVSLTFPLITITFSTEISEKIQVLQDASAISQTIPTRIESISNGVDLLSLIYWTGFSLALLRFLIKIRSIRLRILSGRQEKVGELTLIDTKSQQVFSFFQYVFINRELKEGLSRESIIEHEKAHVRGLHSLDVTLIELVKTVFWFNPVIYAYLKSLKLQHEYIADAHVSQLQGGAYEQTLIRHALVIQNVPLSSAYAQPPIDKRLKMINKTNISPMKKLKLVMAIPLFALLFFAVSRSENIKKHPTPSDLKTAIYTSGQTYKIIDGRVQDLESGKALEKVTIFFLRSRNKTLTNADGIYTGTFSNAEGDYRLMPGKSDTLIAFRKEGYESVIFPYKGQDVVNVKLSKKPVSKKKGN